MNSVVEVLSKRSEFHNYVALKPEMLNSDSLNKEIDWLSEEGWKTAVCIEENAEEVLMKGGHFLLEIISVKIIVVVSLLAIIIVICIIVITCYYCSCARLFLNLLRKRVPKNNATGNSHQNLPIEMSEIAERRNGNNMMTTKFLSYVPIVMTIIGSAEAKTPAPCFVPVYCGTKAIVALLDTGSSITFMDENTLSYIGGVLIRETVPTATAANGGQIPFIGYMKNTITFAKVAKTHNVPITKNGYCPATLIHGVDFLSKIENLFSSTC